MINLSGKLCNLENYKKLCGEILSYSGNLKRSRKLIQVEQEHSCSDLSFDPENYHSTNLEKPCSEKELVENIRTVAEVLIWEDQNDEQGYFEITCKFEIFPTLVELVIHIDVNYSIKKQSLQTLSIILQNIKNINTLYYILSNNIISKLLNNTFKSGNLQNVRKDSYEIDLNISIINKEEEEDELLSYYIVLLRTLALRLNGETLRLFLNQSNEFPLWKNACMYINHRDSMVRNTSRNVLLNILRTKEKEIIDYIVLEEIKQFNHQGHLEEAMRYIQLDPNLIQDLFNQSLSSDQNHSTSIFQILISSIIKQIHQIGELSENLDFQWPEILEYIGIITNDYQESSHNYDDQTTETKESINTSSITATSPITLSYTETESPDEYKSPIINQLNPTFYDHLIKPLSKQIELILDLMELFHEFVFLQIQSVSWLFCNSLIHQVFEMVLFQKITNEITYINQGITKNTLPIKIYLYITYQIILFLYNNNQNKIYDLLISNIWDKFLKLGNQQSLFGNIFSTLINYLEDDSKLVLIFGLLSLYSIWGKKQKDEVKESHILDHSINTNSFKTVETNQKIKEMNFTKKSPETLTLDVVPSLFQSFITNFSSFFQQKDDQEFLIQEIYRRKNIKDISLIEIELMNSISSNLSQRQKLINQRSFLHRRCKSIPSHWKYSQEDENKVLYDLESSNTLMKACINEQILRKDFKSIISNSELLIKKEFQNFYSKLNFEILSQELKKNQKLEEFFLFFAQFLEKIVHISEKNKNITKLRPLCLFVITFLTFGVIQDHETVRQSNYFNDFCSLLDSFMKYFTSITLRHIGDLLRRDLNSGEKYSVFENIGNLNYMICEHFLEWKDEDELLILRMFENYEKTFLWSQKVISNFCILPLVEDSCKRQETRRYIWNLIDTYPIFRWFPNNCCDFFFEEERSIKSRSIFIDKLRSNYNNLQILETFCKMIKRFRKDNNERELEEKLKLDENNNSKLISRKMRILIESKPYKVSIIRASKGKSDSKVTKNIQCNVIFDLIRGNIVLTSFQITPEKKSIMLAKFKIIRCKPVPILTRSYKTAIRYLVALLVRYRKYELEEDVILEDILYELPLREDLLSSPNISKGAIIQPRETKVNKRVYHLKNLLLPYYTRVGMDIRKDEFCKDLNFNDYALYIEFESKKKSEEFIRRLNELRYDKHIEKMFEEYWKIFK
ncbi:Armadillo-like domain containing protein [Cryptosporidium hominis]|uniref:Armadillo-like domain containing protein n=1 Tax=Cryptosporidium hominis TaxID=237895 RepID=A0ABX5BBT9_CRYHO|nr:Armadillo-like domain containing protein [Cryptosporidium hominis]|eukprot:PPS94709.1 Armadillo-like domain containing protein [Cryptosporidium hominis]